MDKKTLLSWTNEEVREYAESVGVKTSADDPKRKLVDAIAEKENRCIEGTTHGFPWTVKAGAIATVTNATKISDLKLDTPGGIVEYGTMLLGEKQFAELTKAMNDDMRAVSLCVAAIDKAVGEGNSLGSASD